MYFVRGQAGTGDMSTVPCTSPDSSTQQGAKPTVQLSVSWQWGAALLSRPVDLTALVGLSRSDPHQFIEEGIPSKIVSKLLNNASEAVSNRDTKLDALTILGNLAACGGDEGKAVVRSCLLGVTHFFEEYLREQESSGRRGEGVAVEPPDLYKAMLLLLARAYDYGLKTEDVLELTNGDRVLALECVLGILEEGETYSLELRQRSRPTEGKLAQWEHALTSHRHEKPLILHMCRLLRGFSHPTSYFSAASEGDNSLTLHAIGAFSAEINALQDCAMRGGLIEKLAYALQGCLSGAVPLEREDHMAVHAVNVFVQNLYLFGSASNALYRTHLLGDTGLVSTLLMPYIHSCVRDIACEDSVSPCSPLLQGLCSSLRTLILASFRAPPHKHVLMLLRRSNPSCSLLRVPCFLPHHGPILALLFLLNINLGALDLVVAPERDNSALDAFQAHSLRQELATCFRKLGGEARRRVIKAVMHAGSLPVSRDTPSYRAVMGILSMREGGRMDPEGPDEGGEGEGVGEGCASWDDEMKEARAEAKEEARHRLEIARRQQDKREGEGEGKECDKGYRLLGQLPPLKPRRELESEAEEEGEGEGNEADLRLPHREGTEEGGDNTGHHACSDGGLPSDGGFPPEFRCAINGHLMSDPVRTPQGHCCERATIELWLRTRGQVCPLTHLPLTRDGLEPDMALRGRIQRWHIERIAGAQQASLEGEDLYEF